MSVDITRGELVHHLLEKFMTRTPQALVAIAASKEGFSVASVRRHLSDKQEDALAVAAARILDMTAEVNNQLEQGHIGRILIEGTERTTIVTEAGRHLVLIVAVPANAKLGLPMLTMRSTARDIAEVYR
jgi:predicted regulator of Ras-like GTPase activity (Roadblock/LC7/MglB family)